MCGRGGAGGGKRLSEEEIRLALNKLDPVWNERFPREQARIVHLLVKRVDVRVDGLELHLNVEGLANLQRELSVPAGEKRAA